MTRKYLMIIFGGESDTLLGECRKFDHDDLKCRSVLHDDSWELESKTPISNHKIISYTLKCQLVVVELLHIMANFTEKNIQKDDLIKLSVWQIVCHFSNFVSAWNDMFFRTKVPFVLDTMSFWLWNKGVSSASLGPCKILIFPTNCFIVVITDMTSFFDWKKILFFSFVGILKWLC